MSERSDDLVDLAAGELKGPIERRKLENLVRNIGMQVAEQLEQVLVDRFATLPQNEIDAAFLAVEDALTKADLSDEAFLATNADPEQLARKIRGELPDLAADRLFAPKAAALYELALDQACRHLVQVVRHLPSFQPRALAEVLSRLDPAGRPAGRTAGPGPEDKPRRPPRASTTTPSSRRAYLEFARARPRSARAAGPDDGRSAGFAADGRLPELERPPEGEPRPADRRMDELWFEKRHDHAGSANMRVETALSGATRVLVRGRPGRARRRCWTGWR